MGLADKLEASRKHRRQHGPWSQSEEEAWLKDHPEDRGTPHAAQDNEGDESSSPSSSPVAEESAPDGANDDASAFRDAVPDISPSHEEDNLDRALADLDILDAYEKFCGKSRVPQTNKTEGIKVSCPDPTHPDRDPSAWINTEKQTYYCAPCDMGGDKFTIAALNLGFPVPGYQTGANFPKLKEKMALELGYSVSRSGSSTNVYKPAPQSQEQPPEQPQEQEQGEESHYVLPWEGEEGDDEQSSNVVSIQTGEVLQEGSLEEAFHEHVAPTLNWKEVTQPDTFLAAWMKETATHDPERPPEYYYWLGLMALGLAIGRDVALKDNPPVFANFFVCLLGTTGTGKSRSTHPFRRLIKDAMPFSPSDPSNKGVTVTGEVGSGEALIDIFSNPEIDLGTFKPTGEHLPVKAVINFGEYASLVSKASRMGSTIASTLIDVYDAYHTIEHRSRGFGHTVAEEPFGSVLTTTQPDAIKNLISQSTIDSGFLNRWVFITGRGRDTKKFINSSVVGIEESKRRILEVRAWAERINGLIALDQEAEAMVDEFHNKVIVPNQDSEPLLGRGDLLLKKILVALAANEHSVLITKRHVEFALKIWSHVRQVYAVVQGKIGITLYDEALDHIEKVMQRFTKKHSRGMHYKEIKDRVKHKYDNRIIREVIRHMVEMGMAEQVQGGGRGKGKVLYVLTDAEIKSS